MEDRSVRLLDGDRHWSCIAGTRDFRPKRPVCRGRRPENRIEGRLLYGTIRSEVSRWLEDYFGNLRKKLTETGLGFYLPADDPKDRSRRFISEPTIRSYFEQGGGKVLPAVPVAGAPAGTPGQTARAVDPVTEEDAQSDWRVSFTFKVRLGDMPPAPPEVKK